MRVRAGCIAALVLIAWMGVARAGGIGIGAYGGVSEPVLQDDTGRGTVYGVRAPIHLVPMLTIEPFYAKTTAQDVTEDFGGVTYTRSGIDVTDYGANLLVNFGTHVQFYPYAGLVSYKLSRDGNDVTQSGYDFGLGLGFGLPLTGLSLQLRGQLDAAVDGDVSRKWGSATAGVTYSFVKLPTP